MKAAATRQEGNQMYPYFGLYKMLAYCQLPDNQEFLTYPQFKESGLMKYGAVKVANHFVEIISIFIRATVK